MFLDEESQSLAQLGDFIGKPISLQVETVLYAGAVRHRPHLTRKSFGRRFPANRVFHETTVAARQGTLGTAARATAAATVRVAASAGVPARNRAGDTGGRSHSDGRCRSRLRSRSRVP